MDELMNQILSALSGVSPVWAAVALLAAYVLRSNGWLQIKLPGGSAPAQDVKGTNPLAARLRDKAEGRFQDLVADGVDEDDAYKFLLDGLREDPAEEEDGDD